MTEQISQRGPIAWMAKNRVVSNLVMLMLLIGGLIMTFQAKVEVFPEFALDIVTISVPYPGASPTEVEQGIILVIEEEVRGLDGIKRVTSTSREGVGLVTVELLLGTNPDKALQDIKSAVDRIRSFPRDAEEPVVSLATTRRQVISFVIHGEQPERVLRDIAERARDELLQNPGITFVQVSGARKPEISIEIPEENLRAYNLTIDGVAAAINRSALELPGGRVKTEGGEILVRTAERRDWAREYLDIPVISRTDGSIVKLRDVALVKETFEDTDQATTFNGEPAVGIDVYRVGDQTPMQVSDIVKKYVADISDTLPPSVSATIWNDTTEILQDRINLLIRNALMGLVLVLITLGLLLDLRLAFWVTMGIPVAIFGAMLFLPVTDVSINMISLFGLIITVGIIVDDAIVVGENIFMRRKEGIPAVEASILGARQMAVPVTFSILTNIVSFTPLLFIPGVMGKFFGTIPVVVITIFIFSLFEALFILPSHIAHHVHDRKGGVVAALNQRLRFFGRGFEWLRENTYEPFLRFALRWRYATVAAAVAVFLFIIALVASGRVEFSFFPKVESDRVNANAVLPYGSPVEETRKIQDRLIAAAREVIADHGGDGILRGIFSTVGSRTAAGGPSVGGPALSGGHLTGVSVYLVPIDQRPIRAEQFVREWRQKVGDIVGIDTLTFDYNTGPASGAPITIELSHSDNHTLERAAGELAEILKNYNGVKDVDDGFTGGKPQLDFKVKLAAQSLGITASDLARQVRGAFFGAEASRNQRGRDEVRVYVRLPEKERRTLKTVEDFIVRAPGGTEIPLREAAEVVRGISYTEIRRADGRRVLSVTGDVVQGQANPGKVVAGLMQNELPRLMQKFPGLTFGLEGQQRDMRESVGSLLMGFVFSMLAIYFLLAIPFKNYVQPFIILMTIPFGIIGAVIGHILLGYEVTVISLLGVVALAGVSVNTAIVLLDTANTQRAAGATAKEAIVFAGSRRFLPIVLTSITTFFGLAPMIFETSVQARFLIPMAISLGVGILFSTAIALVLIPCLFLVFTDVRRLLGLEPREEKTAIAEERGGAMASAAK